MPLANLGQAYSSVLSYVTVLGQQQRFRVRPFNTSVIEGESATLRCEVDHQAGRLQWAKDGFAMGYSRSLPGYHRYRVVGDADLGVHDLELTNATLEDEGRFQCQVSPDGGQPAIRVDAYLTVLLKPVSVRLRSHHWLPVPSGLMQVRHDQNITLECDVTGAKPASGVLWRRNGVDLDQESVHEVMHTSSLRRRSNTTSAISFRATSADDGVDISCLAQHPAVAEAEQRRYTASHTLSVLFGPERVRVWGTTEAKEGDTVHMSCVTSGSNPPANITWFLDSHPVAQASHIVRLAAAGGWTTASNMSTVVPPGTRRDLQVSCRASNRALDVTEVGSAAVSVLCE
ncbi:irregular chiasm C-roughest protein-like [Pollicipes pollicipes]|uniref:irregular chiasm C-roughest protein-like n=1 Tax=Pollicipes pollicipes TaxID=41117 RepID=UPI001884AC31|nr:irregular chiasm C-roughest protein-like [Pollicipes pollicipes]